jgi:phosphodiesterase/alkaline phosphatase D-like protein
MIKKLASLLSLLLAGAAVAADAPFLAQGELVGEVTPTSAIVRARLTLRERPNPPSKGDEKPDDAELPEDLPGAPGRVRIAWGTDPSFAGAKTTPWRKVDENTNFAAQFLLEGLQPATRYHSRAECTPPDANGPVRLGAAGEFVTAPREDARAPVRFCVITGQAMRSRDLETPGAAKGFQSYISMARLRPDFLVSTGDSVYYDNDAPLFAVNERLARYHWNRLYALPSVQSLFRVASGYWEKDDHDYRWNDCGPQSPVPGAKGSLLTDEMGRRLFREAVPMGEKTWRTYRWGQGLQVWLPEGRDFRSPNAMPDGPEKSIWGDEQKAWLKQTLAASPCRYKVLISPTPLVGPDRTNKADNHVNPNGFRTEGREFLGWTKAQKLDGFSVVCGDRHWQYASVDPEFGTKEFCSGPISNPHAGGSPGKDPAFHRYHHVIGGFLEVAVTPSNDAWRIAFRHHTPTGEVANEILDP